jgi:TetR/AcrR family transcriptional repressor of nem operon
MGYSKSDKAETHTRIVKVAAKRFRELGLEGIGVADVMREAGVTVGGFYKHFGSRDELVVEALAAAFKDLDVWEEHTADIADRGRALLILSALLGAINLSRAVSDPNLSREILHGFARS